LDREKTIVDIDHCFPVKGIGTVILGLVKSGQVEAGKMLNLVGLNKKVIIRSIQKQDRDFKTAEGGDRVGLAIKGIKADEIERGFILAAPNLFKTGNKFQIKVNRTQFYKGELNPDSNRQFTAFIGLSTSPLKVIGGDLIKLGEEGVIEVETSKEMPYPIKNAKGIIAELNKFENKLRIVGFFKII
ncbi:MAG: hypothetical protein GY870_17875, partial [archaeon]|nr:hypothetical protein [archaeon]